MEQYVPQRRIYAINRGYNNGYSFFGNRRFRRNGYFRRTGNWGRFNLGGNYSHLRRPYRGISQWSNREVEKKWFDQDAGATMPINSWSVSASLNGITQNTTENGRIGRKIWVKKISIKGTVQFNTQNNIATSVPAYYRLLLIQDRQANGAAATAGQIFEEPLSPFSFLNLTNNRRFKILASFEGCLGPTAVSGSGGAEADWVGGGIAINKTKRVNIPIEFDGTTGAITEVTSNNLMWAYCADAAGIAFDTNVRLRYLDA